MSLADDLTRLNRSAATLRGGSVKTDMARVTRMLQTVSDKSKKAVGEVVRGLDHDHDFSDALYLTQGARQALDAAENLLAKYKT
jgi:hypothetical protein